MTKEELEKDIRTFDLKQFLERDTATISEYSAILIITDNQLILTENGHHGRDFYIDTLTDILKIIYEIPEQKHVFDWHESVSTIEEEAMHPYSIVGFRTPNGTYYGMDMVVQYASSIIGDSPFPKPDDSNNIVGKTMDDRIQLIRKKW